MTSPETVASIIREEVAKLSDRQDALTEFGRTGTAFFSGIISDEEYNRDLDPEKAILVYEKMYRSDGQVRAVLEVCQLPLLEASWAVEAASNDALDVEVGQFVQDNLFGGMNRTFTENLRFILTMLRFGFSVVEQVYILGDDNKIRVRKLAPRMAKTITRWIPNEDDELEEIEQRVFFPADTKSGSIVASGTYKTIRIPGNKVVVFTLNREGNNFRGVSLLRAAYKHWYFKDQLYRLDAIANERQSMGIPWAKEPAGVKVEQADRQRAAEALMSLHAHEKGFMLVPSGWDFGVAGVTGGVKEVLPSIEHHDLQIARSVLAQFLNLDQGGSMALSKDGSSLFLKALRAYARYICDQFNKYIIKPLVDLNYNVERYPTLTCEDLDDRQIGELVANLGILGTAGLLTPNTETENTIRRWLSLPELPVEEGTAAVETDSSGEDADDDTEEDTALLTQQWRRPLTALEQHANLADMAATIDRAKTDLVARGESIHEKVAARLTDLAAKLFAKGETVDVAGIDVPYARELRALLADSMREQYKAGQKQVTEEVGKQTAKLAIISDASDEGRYTKEIDSRATSLSGVLTSKLKATFGLLINRRIEKEFDSNNFKDALIKAGLSDLKRASGTVIIDSMNAGRANEAKKLGAERAQFSAILDSNTCNDCDTADGGYFDVGTDAYYRHMPPYKNCDGQDNCRCVYIYDFIKKD